MVEAQGTCERFWHEVGDLGLIETGEPSLCLLLAELHVNQVEPRVEGITIFKSVGAAHFDLAVANGVVEKAEDMNEGEKFLL